jgi:flagellar protein FliO/FliZ
MQFLTSLIGGTGNTILNAALALGIVLVLIFLALWALKIVMRASNNVVRGGKRRLAVVDTLPVDGKRQLVIIRRDNVEHLILTGGPQDVVVETGIPAETAAARPGLASRRPAQPPAQAAAPPYPQQPQRAPAPQRAPVPEAALPIPSNDVVPPRSPLDRLRDLGRSPTQRRPGSLRHTGLMRPVSRMEPALVPANVDNPQQPPADSATSGTTGRVMPFGGAREGNGQDLDDGNGDGHRDENY